MTYEEIISQVAQSTNLNEGLVDKIYKSYWKAVYEYITNLSLKEDLSDEEFQKLKPNVNIPSLGKLYVTLDRYKKIKRLNNKKQIEYATHKRN